MKRCLYRLLAFLCGVTATAVGNNLSVQNVSLTGQNAASDYTYVQFDISWDNSWRDIVNWDAGWIFVKYRGSDGLWKHATLSTNSGNHTAPTGSTINASSDGKGIFIYRNAIGNGSNNWTTVQLRWEYGADGLSDNALVTVKVFGIEMVYVPPGSFYVGDGVSTARVYDAGLGTASSFYVASQSVITVSNSGAGNLWSAESGFESGTTNSSFPTAFNAFYCMKYEVSQEQYADFLNVLTRVQQNTRTETDLSVGTTSVTNRFVMTGYSNNTIRSAIRCDATISANGPITFYCDWDKDDTGNEAADGQNLSCHFVSWMDASAYADWAALRPMTELEFEKACRGSDLGILAGEYAWGTTDIHAATYTISNDAQATEVVTSQPTGVGNALYNTTAPFSGPFRCGIFALSSTTRQEAGASYFGIMELSGNLLELTVSIGRTASRAFTGNHGDGVLSTSGNANTTDWVGLASGEVTGDVGSIPRGGAWGADVVLLRISDRSYGSAGIGSRYALYGIRCVRTAP